jgi:DNA-binding IclR family transcriptional regulator
MALEKSPGARPAGVRKQEESGGATLQTVERALGFLEIVAAADEPMTIRQVAERLGINVTTCYHVYNTLTAMGYIERSTDATLRIGFEVAALYDGYLRGSTTARLTAALVDDLAHDSGETAWVSFLSGDTVTLAAFAEGSHRVRATGLHVGLQGNEHRRSSGRAVLAFLDDESRKLVLDRALAAFSPEERASTEAVLDSDLRAIRDRGWALDDEQFQQGILGVAAPFFAADGAVLGAVGLWAPSDRGRATLNGLVAHVVAAAQRATATLGRSRR